jgi:uncharacterized protein YqgQ
MMTINRAIPVPLLSFSLEIMKDEIKALVEKGTISRQQPIYSLARYIPAREWLNVEKQLEQKDFLLRDRIADLLGTEKWDND